jgi:hypothetical protein
MATRQPVRNHKNKASTPQELLKKYDFSASGNITDDDITLAQHLLDIELREEKAEAQKRMAWAAIISMIAFSGALFSPMISDSRVTALAELLGLFYLAQAGVVGAYMGFTTWMSKNNNGH